MEAAKNGICVAESAKISRNAKTSDFNRIVAQLASKANARAVVLFVDEDNCRKLLAASKRAGKLGVFIYKKRKCKYLHAFSDRMPCRSVSLARLRFVGQEDISHQRSRGHGARRDHYTAETDAVAW